MPHTNRGEPAASIRNGGRTRSSSHRRPKQQGSHAEKQYRRAAGAPTRTGGSLRTRRLEAPAARAPGSTGEGRDRSASDAPFEPASRSGITTQFRGHSGQSPPSLAREGPVEIPLWTRWAGSACSRLPERRCCTNGIHEEPSFWKVHERRPQGASGRALRTGRGARPEPALSGYGRSGHRGHSRHRGPVGRSRSRSGE